MNPTLPRGVELGHFRIDSLLGAGGMGEVYRAWDGRLDRAVALKILPAERTDDAARLERFVREARAASALAHPHIVAIHEIGSATIAGPETGEPTTVHFIAMEIVEGRSLREAIHDERMQLRDLLRVLSQAAEGISRAHEAGIVHRDLKPDNVMVSRDGYAKVLDFGLAKLLPSPGRPEGMMTSAPTEAHATREGTLVGTVGYMSPEQVQGRPVDHRTDVFTFGCLLYEAATRRRPFEGESSIEVMHGILRETPAPMETLNPEVPAALRRLVHRCLAKDPDRRFQSMRDLALALSDLVDEYASLAPVSSSDVSSRRIRSDSPSSRPRWHILAGSLAIGALLGLGWWMLANRSASDRPTGNEVAEPPGLTMRALTTTADVSHVALSPDGEYLAFGRWMTSGTGIWILHVPTGSSVEVVPAREDLELRGLSFTPDGHHLVFVRNDAEQPLYSSAYQVPVLGGAPRRLFVDSDSGPAFSPDGARIAFVRGAPTEATSYLVVAASDGSSTEVVAAAAEPFDFSYLTPAWSADGQSVYAVRRELGNRQSLVAVSVATGESELLLPQADFREIGGLATLPDGSAILLTGGQGGDNAQIWRVSLPARSLSRLSNDLASFEGLSIAADGRTLATRHTDENSSVFVAPADTPEALRPLTRRPRDFVSSVATAAEGRVFFSRRDPEGGFQLWRTGIDGSAPVQLTYESSWFRPSASADGSLLVGIQRRGPGEAVQVWSLDPETGERRRLLVESEAIWRAEVAPDGSYLTWVDQDGTIWIRDLPEGGLRKLVERSFRGPLVSPDGSRIAYRVFTRDADDAVTAVFEARTPTGDLVASVEVRVVAEESVHGWHPSLDALVASRWIGGRNQLWLLPFDGSGWTPITRFEHGVEAVLYSSAWTPDGRWLVLSKGQYLSDAVFVELP